MMSAGSPDSSPLLTVAVVCKNEAANIERCLDSIVREVAGLDAMIIVVDSHSTDETVALASRFPVGILQLGCDWPHSPAAGRYTAVRHSHGRYLMIIDGDMELLPGFLAQAIALMEADGSVAATRGRQDNYHLVDGRRTYVDSKFAFGTETSEGHSEVAGPIEIESASGAALFRLQSVRDAGNFHPFLKAEEEYELCRRLRALGKKIIYIPAGSVNHYGYEPDPVRECMRRLRRGLTEGAGQVLRMSFREGFSRTYLKRFRQHLAIGLFFLLFLPCMALGWFCPYLPAAWLVLLASMLAAYGVKKRRFRLAAASLVLKGMIGVDIIKALLVPVPSIDAYPVDVTVIKTNPQ